MNRHIDFVKKLIDRPESVSEEELEDNCCAAAYAYFACSGYSNRDNSVVNHYLNKYYSIFNDFNSNHANSNLDILQRWLVNSKFVTQEELEKNCLSASYVNEACNQAHGAYLWYFAALKNPAYKSEYDFHREGLEYYIEKYEETDK
jgi:hypothetical protein